MANIPKISVTDFTDEELKSLYERIGGERQGFGSTLDQFKENFDAYTGLQDVSFTRDFGLGYKDLVNDATTGSQFRSQFSTEEAYRSYVDSKLGDTAFLKERILGSARGIGIFNPLQAQDTTTVIPGVKEQTGNEIIARESQTPAITAQDVLAKQTPSAINAQDVISNQTPQQNIVASQSSFPQISGSIVDYLSSKGFQKQSGEKFPYYDQRSKLYESLGLNAQLGDYRGSAEQNNALLNKLAQAEKNAGVSLNPNNVYQILSAGGIQQKDSSSTSSIGSTSSTGGASNTLDFLTGNTKNLSPEELAKAAVDRVTSSATFPLQMEAQQAEKDALRLQQQRDTESFIKEIAARGLTFSGIKTKGISTIEADTLSKLLGVDRKFALLMTQGIERAAQDIAKEAQNEKSANRKEAIDSLQALGYAINPLTGNVEPTLAAQKAESSAELAQARLEISQANLELSRERLATQQAKSSQSGIYDSQEIAQIQALSQFVLAGQDPSGKEFGLTGVPDKLKGAVAANVLESTRLANTPREWEDDEFRTAIRNMQADNISYTIALQQIQTEPSIQNKDRAELIAKELYGETGSNPIQDFIKLLGF
jgi:hypothetical protein